MSTVTASDAIAPVASSPVIPLPLGRLASVGAVIFCANAAMLVLQLVAGKLLDPFIGSSLETWTSIIGVFLAGIALGNGFGGKLADRYPTPRTLALLLAIGAGTAFWMLVFPMLLSSSGMYKLLPLSPRIPILAAVLCLPAGFVLSLLTPLAIKLGLPDVGHTGRVAGLIFSLSTLGCLIGNYLTGFYLIPTFTINTLVLVSACVLLALAGVSLLMVRTPEPQTQASPVSISPGDRAANSDSLLPIGGKVEGAEASMNPHAFPDIRQAYLIVFLASFCGMTLELTAARVLAQAVGVSLFTWTGVIGVMLAGTAIGNFMGGQLADRAKHASAWLAGAMVLLSTMALAFTFTLASEYNRELPVVEHALGIQPRSWAKYRQLSDREFEERLPELRIFREQGLPTLLSQLRRSLVLGTLVGALVGAILAYGTIRLLIRKQDDTPHNPRYPLAATLCGGGATIIVFFVALSFLTRYELFTTWEPIAQVVVWTFTLFFLPMFMLGLVSPQVIRLAVPDVSHVGRVAGRVYAWSTVGAIVGTFVTGYFLLSAIGMNGTILVVGLLLIGTSLLVAKVWEHNLLLYLFSIALGGIVGGFILLGFERRDGSLATVESNYYTIKVGDGPRGTPDGALSLHLDHLLHSVVDPNNPSYLYYTHEHIQMEFLWLARADAAEPRALVIGGGGYTFPRCALAMMPEATVDVVEIDPKVTRVAYDHLGLKQHPHLHVTHMDGRQFVSERAAPGSYDLVIQDAVNDLSVPGHLMTKEYNDAVKTALKPGGVYLLTIIDSVGEGKLWKAAMATLAKSFPHVDLLTSHYVPESGTPDGDDWDKQRQVLVIYASDKPFSPETLWNAVPDLVQVEGTARVAVLPITSVDLPGSGAAFVLPLALAKHVEAPRRSIVHTILVPPERLKHFTDREPGVVLTDQFCPIDNLMADVFRNRYK